MTLLSWAPRWPLAAASRLEITEAALTSLSAHATVMPSPNPLPFTDPIPSAQLPFCPPTTNLPLVQTLTDLSDDGFIGSHGSLQTHTGLFTLPPSFLPALQETCTSRKISIPPSYCTLLHLLLSLSLLSLCLIQVYASPCHIKGEPGVTEPQAWNINAANCVAVWEINPLKIAPYTSWTHHQTLIHIVTYRNLCGLLCSVYCTVRVSQNTYCLLLCTISAHIFLRTLVFLVFNRTYDMQHAVQYIMKCMNEFQVKIYSLNTPSWSVDTICRFYVYC